MIQIEMKTCSYCGGSKAITDFGIRRRSADGLNSSCLSCRAIIRKKSDTKHPDRYRNFIKENPDYVQNIYKEKKKREPEKLKGALSNRNKKKEPCVICGSTEFIEGHHPDYNDLGRVVWLCRKHHKRIHAGWPIGEMLK